MDEQATKFPQYAETRKFMVRYYPRDSIVSVTIGNKNKKSKDWKVHYF